MARYILIALNGPTQGEGDEQAYNEWYNSVHAADLMRVTGGVSVRRFKTVWMNRIDQPYVAITEFEADDPAQLTKELAEKAAEFPQYIDRSRSVSVLALEIDATPKL